MANDTYRTGIGAVIVGAGMAGLLCALECRRNGINVTIVEREEAINPKGDFVAIGPSAKTIVRNHWPDWLREWERCEWHAEISYFRETGELITGGFQFPWATGHIFLRPQLYKMMLDHVEKLGIKTIFNTKVTGYFEEETGAGVTLANGETLTADLIVAADGLHSTSWKIVNREKVRAKPSGYSVYRTSFPADVALTDPIVSQRWKQDIDAGKQVFQFFLGPDCHANVLFSKETVCWTLVHRESERMTSGENWNARLDAKDAIAEFERISSDWHPALLALVRTTPKGGVTDYRLMLRDPQPRQTSPLGRIVQIGDACHPFLPTSANGAVQAMEDGASLAACLRIGGRGRIGLSTKVHSLLRFERVASAQLMGLLQCERLHHLTSEMVEQNPDGVRSGTGRWIGRHDSEKYAIDRYKEGALHITEGLPFSNTNLPDGYKYEAWTVESARSGLRNGTYDLKMFVSFY